MTSNFLIRINTDQEKSDLEITYQENADQEKY